MSNFHSRILNIPCDASTGHPMFQAVFKAGHFQARNDAAEIVEEADDLIAELKDALQEILYIHANDTVRPRAFYVAQKALNAVK